MGGGLQLHLRGRGSLKSELQRRQVTPDGQDVYSTENNLNITWSLGL